MPSMEQRFNSFSLLTLVKYVGAVTFSTVNVLSADLFVMLAIRWQSNEN